MRITRQTLKLLFAAMVAVSSLGTFAEAAGPRKVVRHRPTHSTGVSAGQSARTTTARKHVVTHKRRATSAKTSKKKAPAKKHVVKAKPKPTTKPR